MGSMRGGKVDDLVVVDNELSRYGFRWVHVMRVGRAVDAEEAHGQFVPGEVPAAEVHRCAWEEKEVEAFHVALSWPAREVVHLRRWPDPGSTAWEETPAVMWWIGRWSLLDSPAGGPGAGRVPATIREAVDLAGTLFELRLDRSATQALLRKLPRAAEAKIGEIEVIAAEWVPEGFVVMV